jgi:hypothetical protein
MFHATRLLWQHHIATPWHTTCRTLWSLQDCRGHPMQLLVAYHSMRYPDRCETCQWTKSHRLPSKNSASPLLTTITMLGYDHHSRMPGLWCGPYHCWLFYESSQVWSDSFAAQPEGFARILQDWVICDHGLPHWIICDYDAWFMSTYMKELFAILSTKQNLSITHHPQTDDHTEEMNQNIEQCLCGFINYHQDDWKEWLFTEEFSYINSVHTAMQQTPFFLQYGQYPWTGEETRWEVRHESAAEFADHMKKARLDEKKALQKAAQKMKWSYDKLLLSARHTTTSIDNVRSIPVKYET